MKVKSYTIDLSELMAVCDANYIRLLKLLDNTRTLNRRLIALPHLGRHGMEEQIAVCVEVMEDFKYTSTIRVSQRFLNKQTNFGGEGAVPYAAPEMTVRVYHDAKTAEVVSYRNHRNFKAIYPVPNQFMYQSDEKEQLNLFLAEWLNLCLAEGLCDPAEIALKQLTCMEAR